MSVKSAIRNNSPRVYESAKATRRLLRLMRLVQSPKLIPEAMHLHRLSRSYFAGWSTTHATRWWEYPWALHQVDRFADLPVRRALEVGAGTSPTPIALRQRDFAVLVIDPDAQQLLGHKAGNEWDFTDYSHWGIETLKAGMEDFPPCGSFGLVMSISVIEHVSGEARRQGLARLAAALEQGGLFVLTVDLIPGTYHLWNRLEEEIESVDSHGDLDTLVEELAAVGLDLISLDFCPIVCPPTDVVGIVALKR